MNKMLITTAGLAEIVNAEQSGTAPVVLSHVAFGTGQYTATADLTKLKSEFKRFDAVAGGAISDNMIHLTIHDNSTDKYTVNEVGVFTASGTLFAVISQTTPIMEKSATSESMLAIDIALTDIDASSISFGDTNLVLNPATTAAAGIVELATDAEAKSGTDKTRAVTPAALDATIESHDNIVHKSGAEAIPGYKCFTGDVGKRNNNADVSVVPENNTYSSFDFSDKNNKKYASVVGSTYTDGDVGAILATNRTINGVEYHSQIHVRLDKDGKGYATAPTPAAGDNSTKIATTAFVNNKGKEFLPLAGGTMSGAIKRAGVFATGTATDAVVSLHGGTASSDGAGIWLYGKDNTNAGKFILRSADANGNVDLVGYPNGGLFWNGKNIVRSVNGTVADAAGNVAITSVQNATNAANATHATTADSATKATQDGTGKVIANTYLAKSGGAMTATKAITRDVNDSYLGLHGGTGTDNDGAQLDLCGANHSSMPGTFQLHARTPDKDVILRGMTDGKLTWGDKYVLTNSYVATVDNGAVMLTAGTQSVKGAYLRLYGADHSTGAGTFAIAASDGTTSKSLTGNADGTLSWGGDNILTKSYAGKASSTIGLYSGGSGLTDWSTGGAWIKLYGRESSEVSGNNLGKFDLGTGKVSNKQCVLTGKADGTLTWNGIAVSAMSMPSDTYTDLTLGASSTRYTAPADGWYVLAKTPSGSNQWINLEVQYNGITLYGSRVHGSNTDSDMKCMLPVKKGDIVYLSYSAGGKLTHFRFIYAEGAKHLA